MRHNVKINLLTMQFHRLKSSIRASSLRLPNIQSDPFHVNSLFIIAVELVRVTEMISLYSMIKTAGISICSTLKRDEERKGERGNELPYPCTRMLCATSIFKYLNDHIQTFSTRINIHLTFNLSVRCVRIHNFIDILRFASKQKFWDFPSQRDAVHMYGCWPVFLWSFDTFVTH